ncbi:hypothetical protein I4F81_001141 [Pyropia yezoensis]|uniref:Uncharacterized protein n=1 Tax=Pyropia yezoensis TaxID=2788 RepID=A0ACC3BKU0_PYRYE|nr:hypothetical protein I4F81_001141 [Neopyropia yezoensis]
MAGLPPDATLPVRWRSTTYAIPFGSLQPSPTVGGLKAALATLTCVPPTDQTLLLPRPRGGGGRGGGGHSDAVLLADVFAGGIPVRPIAMMGAPKNPAAEHGGKALSSGGGGGGGGGDVHSDGGGGGSLQALHDSVIDDLDETLAPPPAPFPRHRRPAHPFYSRRRFTAPPLPAHLNDAVGNFDDDAWLQSQADALHPAVLPPAERAADGGPTNGASLSVEAMADLMAGGAAGVAFTPVLHRAQLATPGYPSEPPVVGAVAPPHSPADLDAADAVAAALDPSPSLADAIRSSRSPAALLAVLLTGPGASSNSFLRSLTVDRVQALRPGVLCWGCDLSPRDDQGAGLLQRLGLHALPAVVVLADVGGGGMGLVDMFDPAFVGFDAVAGRLAASAAELALFLDHTRARMATVSDRSSLLAEQDAAYEESAAADAAAALDETPAATAAVSTSPVVDGGADVMNEAEAPRTGAAADAAAAASDSTAAATASAAEAAAAAAVADAQSRLRPPPSSGLGVAAVALRLPGGRRVVRTFWAGDTLGCLFDWALVEAAGQGGADAVAAAE